MTICILTATGLLSASADTITENTAGLGTATLFPGNSLTTPGGSPWTALTFNWFANGPGTIPTAFGTLFILSQQYLGTPGALNSTTPGFQGQSLSVTGGVYLLDPSLVLQPNTQYFLYANASGFLSGNSDIAGEDLYFAYSATAPYQWSFADANYRLTGQAIPEPSAQKLIIGALTVLGFARCFVRTRAATRVRSY